MFFRETSCGRRFHIFRVLDAGRKARAAPKPPSPKQVDSLLTFDEYHRFDEIVEYIEAVADLYDWANAKGIGQTYEGREMMALELTKPGDDAVANIYIQAGVYSLG